MNSVNVMMMVVVLLKVLLKVLLEVLLKVVVVDGRSDRQSEGVLKVAWPLALISQEAAGK
jgi:hypothetical protein